MADATTPAEVTEVINEKEPVEEPVTTGSTTTEETTEVATEDDGEKGKEEDENRIATVFDDASHFTVKHPLRHKWT